MGLYDVIYNIANASELDKQRKSKKKNQKELIDIILDFLSGNGGYETILVDFNSNRYAPLLKLRNMSGEYLLKFNDYGFADISEKSAQDVLKAIADKTGGVYKVYYKTVFEDGSPNNIPTNFHVFEAGYETHVSGVTETPNSHRVISSIGVYSPDSWKRLTNLWIEKANNHKGKGGTNLKEI